MPEDIKNQGIRNNNNDKVENTEHEHTGHEKPDGHEHLDQVGLLYINGDFPIYVNNKGEYFTISDDTGDVQEFTWEERIMYLCKPWDKASYYEGEDGKHHYLSIVYDWISIDIWRDTLDELMKLLCDMLQPSEEVEDIIYKRIERHNKKLAKSQEEEQSSDNKQ